MKPVQSVKSGYLYVLTHPSDPDLYKIGVTVRRPELRLAEHNRDYEKYAGRIVKETGEKWVVKTFIAVPDPYWAERKFWAATPFSDLPFRRGVELERMDWPLVQRGLDAAREAGLRPGPGTVPDHVYAYTASIRKRLEGRGITLLRHVRSVVSGRSDFRCDNGHEWRTTPLHVGEGQGCPECGLGEQDPEEVRQRIGAGVICLLTHPDKPGLVWIGASRATLDAVWRERPWGDWEIHRYRNVDDVTLAETIIWELLGTASSDDRGPIARDLREAEDAFRDLIYVMREEVALEERRREGGDPIA